ncbi:phage regulatory CII family protein [Bradyrhizobium sp. 18]|uniref:phage regulatory CII family protein n=1 Tax=Bradyrhizobium sp. 18 TaxID=2782657 RepID=UPI001FFAF9C4|nr:phage regulatory CII family protein [Bradyrhizobium sp. 18]MCK1503885.1 hypothetical protein [Bradyrhizobium sp. 18]
MTEQQVAFKAAVRRAVFLAGGPNAAARSTRVNATLLSKYGNIDELVYAPIDVCFQLEQAAGEPCVLRALADLHGFELVARDSGAEKFTRDITALAGSIARESGELISTTIEAAADGNISINDARAIDGEAADLQDKIVSIRTAARKSIASKL